MGFCVVLLLVFTHSSIAQTTPSWVNYNARQLKFPEEQYFTGFASQYVKVDSDIEELLQKVKERAKTSLAEGIRISIKSEIQNTYTNVNSTSLEEFRKVSTSYTQIELSGIEVDTHIKLKKDEIYAFAWIEKTKVQHDYTNKVSDLVRQISASIDQLRKLLDQEDLTASINLLRTLPIKWKQLENAQSILLGCGYDLNEETLTDIGQLRTAYQMLSNSVKNVRNLDLGTLAEVLANNLILQGDQSSIKMVRLGGITYKDTGMSSMFSSRIKSLLEHELVRLGIQINMEGGSTQWGNEDAIILIKGTYWDDQEGNVQVIINLLDDRNGNLSVISSAEAWTTRDILSNAGVTLSPTNIGDAQSKIQVLQQSELKNGGVMVEFWTNKGSDGPIFKEGEKLSIYMKVNRPGYLRLMNYWADGTKLLLADNYYIGYDQLDQVFELPFDWVTACPCGIEFLQAIVQSSKFNPLRIRDQDGFQIIQGDLGEVIEQSRSFRGFLNSNDTYIGEKRITLTTLQ